MTILYRIRTLTNKNYFTEHKKGVVALNHLKLFEGYLLENGKGRRTIEEYRNAVLSLEKWYNGRSEHPFDPDSVTARDLHDWVSHMQTVDRLAPATINKRIASAKVYWSFLTQAGLSNLDPTKKIKMKRISSLGQLPRWMSRKEQDKLLHTVAKEKNNWKKMRNLALVQTMLQAGLRISEVVALDVQDVDFRRKTLTIISGKGGNTVSP